jgi:hypothetical protein
MPPHHRLKEGDPARERLRLAARRHRPRLAEGDRVPAVAPQQAEGGQDRRPRRARQHERTERKRRRHAEERLPTIAAAAERTVALQGHDLVAAERRHERQHVERRQPREITHGPGVAAQESLDAGIALRRHHDMRGTRHRAGQEPPAKLPVAEMRGHHHEPAAESLGGLQVLDALGARQQSVRPLHTVGRDEVGEADGEVVEQLPHERVEPRRRGALHEPRERRARHRPLVGEAAGRRRRHRLRGAQPHAARQHAGHGRGHDIDEGAVEAMRVPARRGRGIGEQLRFHRNHE